MELSYRQINRDLLKTMEPAGKLYYAVLGVDLVILLWGVFAWVYQIKTGFGVTNINNPVGWGSTLPPLFSGSGLPTREL